MPNIEFLITSLIIVLIPGTGVIFTLSTGLISGRRASIFAALGCTAGIVPHLLASVMGLAAILHTSSVAFQALKLLGVVYLIYLAWTMWRTSNVIAFENTKATKGLYDIALKAFLINILNPKLSLFFLAFLPQFVPQDAESPLSHMFLLSAVFMLMTLVVFILYGLAAHGVRAYISGSPKLILWIQRSFAGIFVALGAKLAMTER